MPPRLLYLSGAPRVTTAPDCAEPGPRSHILGIIGGFRTQGWQVSQLIAGDLLRCGRGATDGGRPKSLARQAIADLARLASSAMLGQLAATRSKGVDLCYERLGLMQRLGEPLRARGVPWVLETQSLCSREAAGARRSSAAPRLGAAIERSAYRACDLVVAVSSAVRDEVCAFADIPAERVLVLPNGVDLEAIRPAARAELPPGAPLVVGFVGTIVRWQNLPDLISAIVRLRRRGMDIRLRVAGDGADLAACRDAAADCPEAVSFAGRIPHAQLSAFLSGVDIGYSGQRAEPGRAMYHSPLKLAEYMAAGLPVVASRYPDAVSALQGRADDLLFDAEGASGPEAALAWAWAHRCELGRIGQELRRHAETHLGWNGRVSTLLATLRERGLVR